MEFLKFDQGKTQWHLVPWEALKPAVRALSVGAEKYGPFNWKECQDPTRYFNATMRHLIHHQQGQELDEETGLPSLSHALASLLIYAALEAERGVRECQSTSESR